MKPSAKHASFLRAAVRHLRQADPVMRTVIDKVGPCAMELRSDRFQTLVGAILAQQISGSAARTIQRRVVEMVAPGRITPETIAALEVTRLTGAGVSRQKAAYLHDLAAKAASGELKLRSIHRLPDDEAIRALVNVKGIGVWTAQMFLMFSLGRPDILPHGDLGVQNAIRRLYGFRRQPKPRTMDRVARPWIPYRSVASWYCWRSLAVADWTK